MENVDELRSFAERRERLLTRLGEQRADLDRWLEENLGPAKEIPLPALATFAGLVQLRRDTLLELVALDEDVLNRLLKRRQDE